MTQPVEKEIERFTYNPDLPVGTHMLDRDGEWVRYSSHRAAIEQEKRRTEELEGALREIAADAFYFCNKCGHMGTDGPRHDGCSYEASESGASRIARAALLRPSPPESSITWGTPGQEEAESRRVAGKNPTPEES